MAKRLLIFFIIFIASLFLGLENVEAVEPPSRTIVINEVYSRTGEWIELYNPGNESLNGYTIEDGTAKPKDLSSYQISDGGYLVLYQGVNKDFSFGLNDLGDLIILKKNNVEVDSVAYGNWLDENLNDDHNASAPSQNQSIARIPNGYDSDNDKTDFIIQAQSTPGAENPSPIFDAPKLLSPPNGSIIVGRSNVEFEYDVAMGLNDKIIISQYDDLSIPLIDNTQLDFKKYYWAVEFSQGGVTKLSDKWSFELKDYSNAIMINELMPNPEGDDATGEWIELYNNSDVDVDLGGWKLIDTSGKVYLIPQHTIINAFGYLIISRVDSDITLNNDGDSAKLYRPDNLLLSETQYFDDGGEALAWASGFGDNWAWTTTPTPEVENVFTSILEPVVDEVDEPTINTVPIEIYTGDIQNYLDKLVKIRGKVISTSGNTFYIDDGSGIVKVYIQDKTGINKPEMHKNDVFEIIGVVDIYGQTWRILPRILDDIYLVEPAAQINTKKVTVKKAASAVVSAAKAPVVEKAVAAASSNNADANQNDDKINALDQLVKTMIGLAILFLVFLILKIWQRPKNKNIKEVGGHFGDDFT